MTYTRKIVLTSDKETLIDIVDNLQLKLKKKNAILFHTRTKLKSTKDKMMKLKNTVDFQRKRILELYSNTYRMEG